MATGVSFSHYLEKKVLDHILRGGVGGSAYTQPVSVWLALYTVAPTDQAGGTEVAGNAYARQQLNCAAAADNGVSSGSTSVPSADVTFPVAAGNWGTIVAVGIFDAATVGNMLMYANLTASKVVGQDDRLVLTAANLSVLLD